MIELNPCPGCGCAISSNANACPSCGEPIGPSANAHRLRAGLVLLGIVALTVIGTIYAMHLFQGKSLTQDGSELSAEVEDPQPPSDTEVWEQAKEAVLERIKSPGSARFPDYMEQENCKVIRDGKRPDHCFVIGWVDSQNSFGALIRSQFMVELYKSRNGWSVLDFELE